MSELCLKLSDHVYTSDMNWLKVCLRYKGFVSVVTRISIIISVIYFSANEHLGKYKSTLP